MNATRNQMWISAAVLAALLGVACSHDSARSSDAPAAAPKATTSAPAAQAIVAAVEAAPPAAQTGGFDGAKAYEQVAKLVSFGPRPPGSDGIHRAQDYIRTELKASGCEIDEDDFHASTPNGSVAMKNIIGKSPGTGQGIILLLTHYDTLSSVQNFVGANDSGSSTGLMLEMARNLCGAKQKQPNSVWIAFVDGEEAFVDWHTDNDNTYGSRELAARMATSGELKRVRAVILADMVGQTGLQIPREPNSTKWLIDLVWKTADRLGYRDVFVSRENAVEDDHQSFLRRGVPSVDLIDLDGYQGYWHTSADTLEKVSPKSLAIVGHVILESVGELQKKFH